MVLANYVQSFPGGVVTGYAEPAGRITIVEEAAGTPRRARGRARRARGGPRAL